MMSQRVGHDLVTEQQQHIYLWIIFIPPAGSKGIKGYKVVWLKDRILRLAHPEISDHERTLFGEAVHPNLQGDCCGQLSQEKDIGRVSSLRPPMGLLTVTVGCFYNVTTRHLCVAMAWGSFWAGQRGGTVHILFFPHNAKQESDKCCLSK